MTLQNDDRQAIETLVKAAQANHLDIANAKIRRSSSRFCLGVEHGDYNGTELFGVGTNRFIWFAYKPNNSARCRLYSCNFPDDGVIEWTLGQAPPPSDATAHSWARFPFGVDTILKKAGYNLTTGIDGVLFGNIPGGGMSRSASLTLNLIGSLLDANGQPEADGLNIVDMAQAVENDYIGSPCGQLDQIMIQFAKDGMGTHYDPKTRKIDYVPAGVDAETFRIAVMDTGTDRPGLEKSTYKLRRQECDEFAALLSKEIPGLNHLADVKDQATYDQILAKYGETHPNYCKRLAYIFHAQQRFYQMLDAWRTGDIETVGRLFRLDGIGLRDTYQISGPELETMCDIVRTVPGVLGERMLGGGDKGAAGCLCKPEAVEPLKTAVDTAYPRSRPEMSKKYATHVCKMVQGITLFENALT